MGNLRQKAELVIRINGEDHIVDLQNVVQKRMDDIAAKTRETGEATETWRDRLEVARDITVTLNQGWELVAKTVRLAADTMREAGESLAIEAQFARQFEGVADSIERLQGAAGGRASDTFLQRFASQAERAGLSFDQIEVALKQSMQVAEATGASVEETAQGMLRAVSSASDEYAKQLGLNVRLEELVKAKADAENRSTEAITLAERRALLLEQQTAEIAKNFGDIGLQPSVLGDVQRLEAAWSNMTDTLKRATVPLLTRVAETMEAIGSAFDGPIIDPVQVDIIRGMIGAFERGAVGADELGRAVMRVTRNADEAAELLRAQFNMQLLKTAADGESASTTTARLAFAMNELRSRVAETDPALAQAIDQLDVMQGSALRAAEGVDAVRQAYEKLAAAFQSSGVGSEIAKQLFFTQQEDRKQLAEAFQSKGRGGGRGPGTLDPTGAEAISLIQGDFFRQRLVEEEASEGRLAELREDGRQARIEADRDMFETLRGLAQEHDDRMIEEAIRRKEAEDAAQQALVDGIPGAIRALGDFAGAVFKNKTAEYALKGAGEVAEATAAFARLDFIGGALHSLAAAQFFVAAGTSGPGGGAGARGGGGRRGPELNRPAQEPAGRQVIRHETFILQGNLLTEEGAREIGRMQRKHGQDKAATNPEFVPG